MGEWSKYTPIQGGGWIREQKARSSVEREWAALTFVAAAQAIYLTGGQNEDCLTLTSCERYCIRTDQWFPAPDLNVARWYHSSCVQGRFLFVICGYNLIDRYLNSIEQLDTEADTNGSATQWNLISVSPDVLSVWSWPLVVPINATEILIMGGWNSRGYKSDVYVFNTATQAVTREKSSLKLSDSDNQFKFACPYNQSYVTRKGEIIALVADSDRKGHLISYRYGADTVSKLY